MTAVTEQEETQGFTIGDRVTDSSSPDLGVGTITGGEPGGCYVVRYGGGEGGVRHYCSTVALRRITSGDGWVAATQVVESMADEAKAMQNEALAENVRLLTERVEALRDENAGRMLTEERLTVDRDQWQARCEEARRDTAAYAEQVSALQENLRVAMQQVIAAEQAVADVWTALGEEADRRDWCGEYDRFAEAHGGPSRNSDVAYRVVVTLVSRLDDEDILNVIAGEVGDEATVNGVVDVQWQVTLTGTDEDVRTGRCVCEDHDRYWVRDRLSDESVSYNTITDISRSCDND